MAGYPPPYASPGPGMPGASLKDQRRFLKAQARIQRQQARMQMRAMRRTSIVGPLLLVAAGVTFLLIELGRLRWVPTIKWFGHWWPLVLIAAGLILLVEWAIDQKVQADRTAEGLPASGPRTLGAGTIWLLVFVCLLGGAAKAAGHAGEWDRNHFRFNLADMDRALGDAHDSDTSLVQAIAPDGSLTLDNPAGDITVSGTSDDGQMHVAIHNQVYAMNDGEATRKTEQLKPTVSSDTHWITLQVPTVQGGHADLVVELPRSVALTLTAERGEVRVSGMHAPAVVNSNRGSVDLSGITGLVNAHMHSARATFSAHSITGPVNVDGRTGDLNISDVNGPVALNGDFFGTTHVEHVTGSIHFHTSRTDFQLARLDGEMELDTGSDLRADQVLGPVTLTTRQRNITLERVQGPVQVANRDGFVTITSAAPLGSVDITNRHGSVDVGVPENAGFTVQASTRHGDLENDFALAKTGSGNNPSIGGTVHGGGPLLHIETSDGDVTVRKSVVAPLPPLPPLPPRITPVPPPAPAAPAAPPKVPAAPKLPAIPRIPSVPKIPAVPAIPRIPAGPEVPTPAPDNNAPRIP